MDAREREKSQSRPPSIKRPWDEDNILPENNNTWQGPILPPIDVVPYPRSSVPRGQESGSTWSKVYGNDSRESVAKKAKYDGQDYISISREIRDPNRRIIRSPAPYSVFDSNPSPSPLDSPRFPPKQGGEGREGQSGEAASSQETGNLCRRCRRLTTQHQGSHSQLSESCEDCKRSPELAHVTQMAAAALSQLAETLSSGISSEHRGIIRDREQQEVSPGDFPPIAQFGLKHTLNWILGKIQHANILADKLVEQVPPRNSRTVDRKFTGTSSHDATTEIMKRRMEADLDEAFRSRSDATDPNSDARLHSRRRSLTTTIAANEELPPIRSHHDYHTSQSAADGISRRGSIMNPPPAPNRQLPSPPGRSLPSPTSLNFPSPSAGSYGSATQPLNLPPPSTIHQPSPNNYLPPLGSAHSSDALQAHSAALQHEVSLQKIALSSLQGEHDKLLAAFSRSQTRAAALEKKHTVADSEIISLSEEKLRLQNQVIDLERDVEELSRSRDDFRQAAVQEGAQYVEIVKKASQLEEMAAEERKTWGKLKAEMEERIEALSGGSGRKDGILLSASVPHVIDDIDTPASSADGPSGLKIEPISDVVSTSYPMEAESDSNARLKEEIQRLQNRSIEVESALRAVRDESRSIEGIVQALGLTGKSILERADKALESAPKDQEAR